MDPVGICAVPQSVTCVPEGRYWGFLLPFRQKFSLLKH
jgi:hypothetical protein